MNKVSGTHFLFVWNPNICSENIPLSGWYPGNAYVNIIGADAYDVDCNTLQAVGQEGWTTYYTNNSNGNVRTANYPSLSNIEAFAVAHGKPMSFPEWGLTIGNDDAAYVNGLVAMFNSQNFSFQSYFDNGDDGIAQLGSSIPKSTLAAKAFK
jgi:beta-mannanase